MGAEVDLSFSFPSSALKKTTLPWSCYFHWEKTLAPNENSLTKANCNSGPCISLWTSERDGRVKFPPPIGLQKNNTKHHLAYKDPFNATPSLALMFLFQESAQMQPLLTVPYNWLNTWQWLHHLFHQMAACKNWLKPCSELCKHILTVELWGWPGPVPMWPWSVL